MATENKTIPPLVNVGIDYEGKPWVELNITLRDLFAAFALSAVITKSDDSMEWGNERIARWSYFLADAMLAAREGNE